MNGANIGDGSVVGAYSVTSSKFKNNVIIAGAPAKIIKENIIWSKDANEIENIESIDDCVDKKALTYL